MKLDSASLAVLLASVWIGCAGPSAVALAAQNPCRQLDADVGSGAASDVRIDVQAVDSRYENIRLNRNGNYVSIVTEPGHPAHPSSACGLNRFRSYHPGGIIVGVSCASGLEASANFRQQTITLLYGLQYFPL